MGWDSITGDKKILPSSGGNSNEVKLESGKFKKVKLMLRPGEEPYSYLEHPIENEVIENGQSTRIFRTVRCAKTSKNPNAPCKICDGQRFPRRPRNAANVWDYELNQVQKLNGGEKIWSPIASLRKMGVDPLAVDWGILKTGKDRNDTDYNVQNLGPAQLTGLPPEAQLFDIEADYAPHTEEEMKAVVEQCGFKWETIIVPPDLQFPKSTQEALDHVMPNGKYKGQTMRQMWDADKTPKGMINYLATKSDRMSYEKACAQVIMVNLGGANIPGVPNFSNGGQPATTPNIPSTTTGNIPPPPAPTTPTTPAAPPPQSGIINEINGLLQSKEKFVKGGYPAIMEAMKTASGGKTSINEFTEAELNALLKICKEA